MTLKDRLTGERITCVFPEEVAQQIGPKHDWSEVWAGRRVLVGGALHYDADGQIRRIDIDSIESIQTIKGDVVDMAALRGVDLLQGETASAHLDTVWGAERGQN